MRFVFLPNFCTCSACEFEAEAEQTCHAEERPHAAVKRLRPLESVRSITKGPLSVFFFSTIFFVMSFVGISWTVYWFLFGSQFWDWPIHCWMNPSVFVYLTTSNRGPTVQVLTVLGWFGFWHNNLERNSLPNLAQVIFNWCWTNEISIWPAMKLWVNEFQ